MGLAMNWWTHLLTFLAGLGAGWQLKVAITNRSSNSSGNTFVSQKNNRAGGDIVGGDSRKSHRE
jgi:hypothetical protein